MSQLDECCACYGCPDHPHDCGLPPLQAAMRRARFLHHRRKAIQLIIAQGLAAPCAQCGTLYDTRMVDGPNCIEHGGNLVGSYESGTTAEQFDTMWKSATPTETIGYD